MPYADLTEEEKVVVDALARRARKKIVQGFRRVLETEFLEKPRRREKYAHLLGSIGQKLSNPSEEILGVQVRTLRMLVTENLPTEEQLWAAIKDVI